MLPYFSIEYFYIGPFKFYTWGFFLALAFLVGLILAIWQAKKIGIEAGKIIWLVICIYIGVLIGSRLFFVLQWPAEFFSDPLQILRMAEGGMMFYGGLFGGLAGGWLYLRKWENRWKLINLLISIIPLSLAIGRIGCFLLNDHQGGLTSLPWAIRWPDGSLRQPAALYLILFDLALAGFLWWFSRRHSEERSDEESPTNGQLSWPNVGNAVPHARGILHFVQDDKKPFLLFIFFYSLGRFLLDFTRDPSADPHFWGLAISQWISVVILIVIFLYDIIYYQKNKRISA